MMTVCRVIHLAAVGLVAVAGHGDGDLYRYWPRMQRPERLIMVPFVGDHEEGMVFETAAGLAAQAVRAGDFDTLLCEDVANSGYERWLAGMREVVEPEIEGPVDVWQAVEMLKREGIVRGYLLYRYDSNERRLHHAGPIDESANVATSLAAVHSAVAVSERLQEKAEDMGLEMVMDVREKTEAWCLAQYADRFSRELVMTADPKSRVARSLAVALEAFVVSGPESVYEAVLARCRPDRPVLGWGCGDERQQTLPSSEWGLFQTATNWCHNLPVFSTEEPGETIPRADLALPERCRTSLADITWEEGVHYASFIMSDGDNVQWMMGNFAGGSEGRFYYESPVRGEFPFGWTFAYVDLCQLCPYMLRYLFEQATANDDFVLYGGGYYYPDRFGCKRGGASESANCPGEALAAHARRIGAYMQFGGLRTLALNLQDWDGPEARRAYETFAQQIPSLDGIFTVQYYPYSGGEGRVLWAEGTVGSVPIISCRLCIWANTGRERDTTPAGVAKWLNGMPRGGATWSEDNFSFVMAHSWSRFRDIGEDPSTSAEEEGVDQGRETAGTSRGLLPVKWAVRRLNSDVRVVTPTELALLAKLHLRTRETLAEYLKRLGPAADACGSRGATELLRRAQQLLPGVGDGDGTGRQCFELLQRADRLCREAEERRGRWRR